jgi:TonB family protein
MGSRPSTQPIPGVSSEPGALASPESGKRESRLAGSFHGDPHERLADWLQRVKDLTCAAGVAICLKSDDTITCRASDGYAPDVGVEIRPNQGICGKCISEGQLVLAQDVEGDVRSVLAVPVKVENEVEGLVVAFATMPYAFTEQAVEGCEKIAAEIAESRHTPILVAPPVTTTGSQAQSECLLELDLLPSADDLLLAMPSEVLSEKSAIEPQVPAEADVVSTLFALRAEPAEPQSSPDAQPEKTPKPTQTETPGLPIADSPSDMLGVLRSYTARPGRFDDMKSRFSPRLMVEIALGLILLVAIILGIARLVGTTRAGINSGSTPTSTANAPITSPVSPRAPTSSGKTRKHDSTPSQRKAPRQTKQESDGEHSSSDVLLVNNGSVPKSQTNTADVQAPAIALRTPTASVISPVMTSTSATPKLASTPTLSTIVPARLVERVEPVYPSAARSAKRSGSVLLALTVTKDGRVGKVTVLKGDSLFSEPAKDAATRWKYTPASEDGKPVESVVQVTVNFKMQ